MIPTNSAGQTASGSQKSQAQSSQPDNQPLSQSPLAQLDSQKIYSQKVQQALTLNGAELGICPAFANIRPQFNIHSFAALPSTNTKLWELLAAGAPSGTVVIARQQSAGKGQRGRTWQSDAGGAYLSLALEPDWPVDHSAQLTCLSAWGIATALNNLGINVKIKWPNDILFEGKKLGGILTETKLAQSIQKAPEGSCDDIPKPMIKQAVIGVGINWHNPVPETGITLVNILEGDKSPQLGKNKINCLEKLIALVLRGILQGVVFQQQVGSQVFMKAYQKLLTQVGQTVSLDSSGKLSLALPTVAISGNALEAPRQVGKKSDASRWANRSGEVIGVSEEGYLQVALHQAKPGSGVNQDCKQAPAKVLKTSVDNILLLKPSEIHIR